MIAKNSLWPRTVHSVPRDCDALVLGIFMKRIKSKGLYPRSKTPSPGLSFGGLRYRLEQLGSERCMHTRDKYPSYSANKNHPVGSGEIDTALSMMVRQLHGLKLQDPP